MTWHSCPTPEWLAATNPVRTALRAVSRTVEQCHGDEMRRLVDNIQINRHSTYAELWTIAACLSDDGGEGAGGWGRVCALFVFCGLLAVRCVREGHGWMLGPLSDFLGGACEVYFNLFEADEKKWVSH